MWRRVDLKNYRSIESVSVELAPFSALVGPNGSGKSNFADALVFARDVATDAAAAVERRGGISGLRRWRPTKPSDVTVDIRAAKVQAELETDYVRHQFTIHSGRSGKWTFRKERIEMVQQEKIVFWIERTAGKLKMSPPRPPTFFRPGTTAVPRAPVPPPPPPRLPPAADPAPLSDTASAMVLARQFYGLSSSAALRNVRRVRLNPEAMRQPQPTTENPRLDESGSNVGVAYRSLRASAQAQILAAMQKIVPGLSRISVDPFDRFLLLKFDQRQRGGHEARFSATEMSEGALRALGILVAAQQMTPDELLIIEEPEVSIHVGAARLLFDVLEQASRRGAVLVTTHSADLLDAARDEEILVCSYHEGVTDIGPLASAQREIVRQGLFSVAELMRSEPLRIEGEAPAAAELEEINETYDEDASVILTSQGWVKRVSEVKDLSAMPLRAGDSVLAAVAGSTRASVAFFSNWGGCYVAKIHDLPASMGYGARVQKLFKLGEGEHMVAMLSFDARAVDVPPPSEVAGAPEPPYALAVMRSGFGFRFSLRQHRELSTRTGRRFARPKDGDEVVALMTMADGDSVVCVSSDGRVLGVSAAEIPALSGASKGAILMDVEDGERLVGAVLAHSERDTVTIETEQGRSKKLRLSEVLGHRANKGTAIVKRDRFTRIVPAPVEIPTLEVTRDGSQPAA